MKTLVLTGLACSGAAPTPTTTPAPTSVATPTPALTPSPTAVPEPTQAAGSPDEVRDAFYSDASGLFSVPIPTNWSVESADGYGILTAPDNDFTIYVLAVEGPDVEAAIVDSWAEVDPEFDLEPRDVIEQSATGGVEKAFFIVYDDDDVSRIAIARGQLYHGVVYVLLGVGDVTAFQQREYQVSIIASGFDIIALEKEDLTGIEPLRLTGELLDEFEAYVVDAMERLDIPGSSVSVVQGGEIVYANGFGVRERGKSGPVTPETLMMIGSVTKSMTTMLMATLVDDGLMEWDTPMVEVLPTFALADSQLTREITARNLVCACTGVPRRDFELLLNYDDLSAEDIIESLATFELFTDFGEAFQYSNQMVATGGYVAAAVVGAEYGSLYDGYEKAI